MDIDEFIEVWDRMLFDPDIWQGTIAQTQVQAVDVNKQQLLDGLDSTGDPLPVYRPFILENGESYSAFKLARNPRNGGRYDMNRTSASFNSMRIFFEGEEAKITGEGWAATYHRGSAPFSDRVAGKIYGIYENDYLWEYRHKYLYPLIIELIKARTGVE